MRRLIIGLIILVVAIPLIIFGLGASGGQGKTATLDVQVAPSGASAQLNGKGIGSGKNKVKPGTYKLTASMKGFATDSVSVDIKKDETKIAGLVLKSNSPETATWYQDHPKDALLAEGITGRKSDQRSNQLVASNPLLAKLPFIGPGFSYRIDYGASQKGSSQPAIYIRSQSEAAKNEALAWITNQGYNLSSMEIIYINESPSQATSGTTQPSEE
jgi:hypothetical protein